MVQGVQVRLKFLDGDVFVLPDPVQQFGFNVLTGVVGTVDLGAVAG